MPDEPRKIFDLMDTETEPTDEQLEELMNLVGEDIRAESARIKAREIDDATSAIVSRLKLAAVGASGSDQAGGLAVH